MLDLIDSGLLSDIDQGPTMFPIVFAAIIGRSMKMIARYLAERGSKLSVSPPCSI
jgi:hypothetical protein